jgi:hypothetical protein
MEQFKNILLGFLLALVIVLGCNVYSLKKQISEMPTKEQTQDVRQDQMFNNFLSLVKELKKLEQEDKQNAK